MIQSDSHCSFRLLTVTATVLLYHLVGTLVSRRPKNRIGKEPCVLLNYMSDTLVERYDVYVHVQSFSVDCPTTANCMGHY